MLNENKVKIMARMAMYEGKKGTEDFKINSYYKRDYVSYKTLISILWMTVGYAAIVMLGVGVFLDEILEQLTLDFAVMFAICIVGLYLALALLYAVGAGQFYKKKYSDSRKRLKKFNQDLSRLSRMYEKEKR